MVWLKDDAIKQIIKKRINEASLPGARLMVERFRSRPRTMLKKR
jgi:hypothetical protein